MNPADLKFKVNHSLQEISAPEWNAMVSSGNPFMEYDFLLACELSGVVGESTTWKPRYAVLKNQNQLIGAIPFYLKTDSYGEFIWDFEWAQAYHQAKLRYYPKATVAVPFTPATGERILVHPEQNFEEVAGTLVDQLLEYVQKENLSSLHFLFVTEKEQKFLESKNLMSRLSFQYHWKNRGYQKFDDWLEDLKAKKAGEIRRERRRVAELKLGIRVLTGDEIELRHLQAMAEFYEDTCSRKWGPPRLNARWFELMYELEACRKNLVLVMAQKDGHLVAGTINFRKGPHLYGRYWGALGDYPYLHFECCYYQLIEYAIQEKIQLYEAGAQGEHKFIRGFDACPTYSSHWFANSQARVVLDGFLQLESKQIRQVIKQYSELSSYKNPRHGNA